MRQNPEPTRRPIDAEAPTQPAAAPTQPAAAQPPAGPSERTAPRGVGMMGVEPGQVEPGQVEPGRFEPGRFERGPLEPRRVEPNPARPNPARPNPARPGPVGAAGVGSVGLLARMRIRKKLIFLHTLFSTVLTVVLLVLLGPALNDLVHRAEWSAGEAWLETWASRTDADDAPATQPRTVASVDGRVVGSIRLVPRAEWLTGEGERAERLPGEDAARWMDGSTGDAVVAQWHAGGERVRVASLRMPEARRSINIVLGLLVLGMLAVYGLIAAGLEVMVLPRHVYEPIRRMLVADAAVASGPTPGEMIDDAAMPADELGEIMRSRNAVIRTLREKESALASALSTLEAVAGDLKRKNDLVEAAQRSLADADRLASLGMMSAGIAHELNTPLAVVKGLASKIQASHAANAGRPALSDAEAALLVRVVTRLERLSESLLDFARVRPPLRRRCVVAQLVDEAITLVRLDRDAGGVMFDVAIAPDMTLWCDGDRVIQVLVNLIRNAVDALREHHPIAAAEPRVRVSSDACAERRAGREWAAIVIEDNGPGIPPAVLSKLFEPFVTQRLDDRGTGLGLAVAEGIVKEHGGTIIAGNRPGGGAVFRVILPAWGDEGQPTTAALAPGAPARAAGDADDRGPMTKAPL